MYPWYCFIWDMFWIHTNGQRNPKSDFSDFYFLSYGYVSVRVMVRDWSTEKHCSRQFLNAVEREPVRLGSSIQKKAGSLPQKKNWRQKISTKNFREIFEHFFIEIFFFLKLKKKILKIVWNVPEIFFIDIGRKFFLIIFLTF